MNASLFRKRALGLSRRPNANDRGLSEMSRHIAWFNEAPVGPNPAGGLISDDADVRRRCLTPARAIEKLGVSCSVFGNLQGADPTSVARHLQKLDADIVVVGKITGLSLVKLARMAKQMGCFVIADLGNGQALSPDVLALADIADQLVISSDTMATAIEEKTGQSTTVIPDCEDTSSALATYSIAKLWLDCFSALKMKPPTCANTNVPIV